MIEGVVPILPTPFAKSGGVEYHEISALVEFGIHARVSAIGTPAFGSEFYKLDGIERQKIIETVLLAVNRRIPVIIQCNHHYPEVAARMASEAEKMGATVVNTALPRAFASSSRHLLDYARRVCDSVSLPVVVQDWNPAGKAEGLDFIVALHQACPNFRYFKYEEPGLGPLCRDIMRETDGRVRVFSGWGGSYVLEQIPAGLCGVMPGLALADWHGLIWEAAKAEDWPRAFGLFADISPYMQFSLQTFEQFHHAEKQVLARRGILQSAVVRPITIELNSDAQAYLEKLMDHLERRFAICPEACWARKPHPQQ
ncbi:MAG: dihydrodipicolinate synthase family protein [Terrimicrobiaceae bacterium]|jgi:4-hydroxy-tetrahydrodipicolinate synthase|nr:dihydrodipicolinate synthase family protein [Terrimicrobiaceae bacterium]